MMYTYLNALTFCICPHLLEQPSLDRCKPCPSQQGCISYRGWTVTRIHTILCQKRDCLTSKGIDAHRCAALWHIAQIRLHKNAETITLLVIVKPSSLKAFTISIFSYITQLIMGHARRQGLVEYSYHLYWTHISIFSVLSVTLTLRLPSTVRLKGGNECRMN